MAYDEILAQRIRKALEPVRDKVVEQKMFGGIAFMYRGKMACGVVKGDMMVRIIPEKYEAALKQPYVREMDFTKRPMKGFLFIGPKALETEEALQKWVETGIEFVDNLLEKDKVK